MEARASRRTPQSPSTAQTNRVRGDIGKLDEGRSEFAQHYRPCVMCGVLDFQDSRNRCSRRTDNGYHLAGLIRSIRKSFCRRKPNFHAVCSRHLRYATAPPAARTDQRMDLYTRQHRREQREFQVRYPCSSNIRTCARTHSALVNYRHLDILLVSAIQLLEVSEDQRNRAVASGLLNTIRAHRSPGLVLGRAYRSNESRPGVVLNEPILACLPQPELHYRAGGTHEGRAFFARSARVPRSSVLAKCRREHRVRPRSKNSNRYPCASRVAVRASRISSYLLSQLYAFD